MEEQATVVLQQYGVLATADPILLHGGTANRNYLIRSGDEPYVLRVRHTRYSGEMWLAYEQELLQELQRRGLPVPLALPNNEGRGWTVRDGTVYQLFRFLSGEPFSDKDEEVAAAGDFLGRLHEAVRGFEPASRKELPRYDDPVVTLEALMEARQSLNEEADTNQREVLDFLCERCCGIAGAVPDSAYAELPQRIIHGDYHPANVKYDETGRICGVFDFDWASRQPRLRDLADGVAYFAARRRMRFDGGNIYSLTQSCSIDPERTARFLRSYESRAAPLSARERELLADFVAIRLITSRVLALRKIPPERKLAMLTEGIEPQIRWLADHRTIWME